MNELWQAFNLSVLRRQTIINFVLVLFVLSIGYIIMHFGLETRMTKYVAGDLSEDLSFISKPLENKTIEEVVEWCSTLQRQTGRRFSIINSEGVVLCDNYANINTLVNHSDRPEFIEALEKGYSTVTRPSTTSDRNMVYASAKLIDVKTSNPFVIRVALPHGSLTYELSKMRSLVLNNLLAVLVIFIILFLSITYRMGSQLKLLEAKLGRFMGLTNDDIKILPELQDEWEKVDYTIDQIYRDLTAKIDEIEQGNNNIRTIVESIDDGLLAIDQHQKVLFLNQAFKQGFDLGNENVLKKSLIEAIRDVDIRQAYAKCLQSGQFSVTPFDRHGRKFELRVFPLYQKGKTLSGAVGIFHDVTQWKLLQKMREDFVANVSHEVRTPLTAIKGYAQILTSLDDINEFQQFAQKIEHNVDRLSNLFQDILMLSVLESNEQLHKEKIDVKNVIQTTLSNLAITHQDKDIKVHSHFANDTFCADEKHFEQVVTNLLDNAFKYTPEKGSIFINTLSDDYFDILEIKDSGIGISKNSLNRIFERFYRVDESRSREIGGTGLGLAIVKHIVQKHRGTISVESEINAGTTFLVKFPKAQV